MASNYEDLSEKPSVYSCRICLKKIHKNQQFIICYLYNHRIHLKCSKVDITNEDSEQKWCVKCKEDSLPFQKLTDNFFATAKSGLNTDIDSLELSISPVNRLKSFFKDIII